MKRRYTLRPPLPYSLDRTVQRLVRFEEIVHRYEEESYRRLLWPGRTALLVRVEQWGPPSRAELHITLVGREARSSAARRAADQLLARVLGAYTPVRAFYGVARSDPFLAEPARRLRGLRVAGAFDLWEALATAVFSQQVNLRLAYSIRRELAERYGRRARFDGELYVAFPRPGRIAREPLARLRQLRLSQAKAETLQRTARLFASGKLMDAELAQRSDEHVIAELTAIKGIGRWTAEVGLMRGLARPDAFPAADLGVVKYLARELSGQGAPSDEATMRRFAERWRPHRALALAYAYEELRHRSGAR